jgi:trans-aconitate methyltransferase
VSALDITVLLAVVAAALSIVGSTIRAGISPMPSSARAVRAVLELLPDERGSVADLGSGWGTLTTALARAWPGVAVVGYELSPVPWLFSVIRARLFTPQVRLHRGDFMRAELGTATVVVCYLYPGGMTRLKGKLLAELRPNTVVISNTFALPDWTPERVVTLGDLHQTKVYRYRVPSASAAGSGGR